MLDSVTSEAVKLRGELLACRNEIRELEARPMKLAFLQDAHNAMEAELRQCKTALAAAEDQARLTKPVRDALVKELQVRGCERGPGVATSGTE